MSHDDTIRPETPAELNGNNYTPRVDSTPEQRWYGNIHELQIELDNYIRFLEAADIPHHRVILDDNEDSDDEGRGMVENYQAWAHATALLLRDDLISIVEDNASVRTLWREDLLTVEIEAEQTKETRDVSLATLSEWRSARVTKKTVKRDPIEGSKIEKTDLKIYLPVEAIYLINEQIKRILGRLSMTANIRERSYGAYEH